jgi:D-3-phosphoglycerate dehydrogenase / 2-oxoglutarate reductase
MSLTMTSAVKVLIADALSDQAVAVFAARGVQADVNVGLKPDELAAIIQQYQGIAIRSSTKITKDILDKAPGLKVVGRAGIGVDNVDVPAATARGVVVMNTPHGNAITTAEHAIALMFALARQLPQASASTHQGKWEKNRFMGVELTGKTLGVVGCGNIGSIVAERALGLKMKVIAFDPYLSDERARTLGVEKVTLEQLLPQADIITLHTPLTEGTKGLLNKQSLATMKKGALLINCARGGLVVEADLKEALDSGHLGGAALDVFEVEPAKENVLFGNDKVVATPHLGASTTEAQEKVAVQVAEQMCDYLLKGAVQNAVNMPSLSAEEAARLKPYLKLAELLGSFAAQLADGALTKISIDYAGTLAALNTRPLSAQLLTALLRPHLDSVNPINAGILAKERGIEVKEVRGDANPRHGNCLSLHFEASGQAHSLVGTVFEGGAPRILEIEGIPIEAEAVPFMLLVKNHDKPGFIGAFGKTLGEAGINIATFTLGRTAPGADALALAGVDQPVPAELVQRIAALPHVVRARLLRF